MRRVTAVSTCFWVASLYLFVAGNAGAQQCPAGFTNRFTIVNNAADDIWLIETPPGQVQPVQGQWDWFKDLATTTKILPNGGTVAALLLKAGQTQRVCVPDKGSPGGQFRFYMGCPNHNTTPFDPAGCEIGSDIGDLSGVNTLFEPTFGCMPGLAGLECAFNPSDPARACQSDPKPGNCASIASVDNFDISAVDGYTIPLRVDAVPLAGQSCNRNATDGSMLDLASCPTEDEKTLYSDDSAQQAAIDKGISLLNRDSSNHDYKAYVAPYKWFYTRTLGTPPSPVQLDPACDPLKSSFNSSCYYAGAGCDGSDPALRCPNGSGPQEKVGPKRDGSVAIQNTHWVQDLYALGYNGYTWQYGDGVGDQACSWGGTITLTLVPKGGVPYRGHQLWQFSTSTRTCSTDGSTGSADGTTTFQSLADCQRQNMRFTCDNMVDQVGAASPLWKADAQATLAGRGFTYSQVHAARELVHRDYQIIIAGQQYSIPQDNYIYSNNGACPASGIGSPPPTPIRFEGEGRADRRSGDVLIRGSLNLNGPIDLRDAQLNISQLLNDGGVGELVTAKTGKSFLPLTLLPSQGSRRDTVVYETSDSSWPSVRAEVTETRARQSRMEFSILVTGPSFESLLPVSVKVNPQCSRRNSTFGTPQVP